MPIFFAFLMLIKPSFGQDIYQYTILDYKPNSYRVEYGGLYKTINTLIANQLKLHWRKQIKLAYSEGDITYSFLEKEMLTMSLISPDIKLDKEWFLSRRWWDYFPPEAGGAPKKQAVFHKGRTRILFDYRIFYVTTAFEIKTRAIRATIDIDNTASITLAERQRVNLTSQRWSFVVSPIFDVSLVKIFSDISKSIEKCGLDISCSYSSFNKKLYSIVISISYCSTNKLTFGLLCNLARW